MEEDVFIPKYRLSYRIGGPILMMFGGGFALTVLLSETKDVSFILVGFLMFLIGVVGSVVWINYGFMKVVFQETKVLFIRRFVSPIAFSYSELTDIGYKSIEFNKKRISLMMENNSELIEKFHTLVEKGSISPSQIKGDISLREEKEFKVGIASIVPIILVSLFLDWFFSKYFDVNLDDIAVFVIASLIVIPVTYILIGRSE